MCNTEDCLHYDYVRLAWDVGFTFEEYDSRGGFDISVIGLVDVEKVAKERDIPTVVKHIPTLLQFRLDDDFGKVLEPNFIKLFRLSQLSIQYLIFCKKYLDSTVALLKTELVALDNEKGDMELFLEELKSENDEISRKYEELKATLSTSTFKCEQCAKTFYSEEYLLAHIKRRHQVHSTQMQTEADRLQLEIKELKQRLNNTEKLILKDDDFNEKGTVMSPKESAATSSKEKEKEQDSIEPNNDAILENSIQYKFEQLKHHIETEINSLKDEDFYKNICEKYIKERVDKSFTPIHISETIDNSSQTKIEPKDGTITTETSLNKVEINAIKGVESCTQTECTTAVSEGTTMSPQPKPRKRGKSMDETRTSDLGSGQSDQSVANTPVKSNQDATENEVKSLPVDKSSTVIKTIEEKLAKEAELQRETLEHILDLKLSGSLNKMEAQMAAFWEKLNAWESNLSFTKSSSVPSVNIQSQFAKGVHENRDAGLVRQNSLGSIASTSPINKMPVIVPRVQHRPNVPKALPRNITNQVPNNRSPVLVIPKPIEKSVILKGDVTQFLDSSDEDVPVLSRNNVGNQKNNVSNQKSSKSSTETTSEEEPSNMKPTDSFRKHLDETLLQRLNPPSEQPKVQIVSDSKPSPVRKFVDKSIPKIREQTSPPKEESPVHINTHLKSLQKKTHHNHEQRTIDHDNQNRTRDYKEMTKRLKRHVEDSVNQRLRDIGVSPHWKCLPEKSFVKAMQIVEHQASLSKKNIHDFHKIRKSIERAIDKDIVKPSDGKNRCATVNLPLAGNNVAKLVSKSPSPVASHEPTEDSVEIPLQRITGQSTLIPPNTRRASFQSDTSNSTYTLEPKMKLSTGHQSKVFTKAGTEVEQFSEIIVHKPAPSSRNQSVPINAEVTAFETPSGTNTDSIPPSLTKSVPSSVPQNQKKKVLFNLDTDTEHSEQSPVKQTQVEVHNIHKDLGAFVQHEKTKLDVEKQGKQKGGRNKGGHDLHTGSESSDWDISDIT